MSHTPPPSDLDPWPLLPDDLEADSEPRRRWKPNPALLRALANARKDLKPGESSLFWDWTATREAAPEAEEMRPSGEGEVFVCDKDAAAAYIAPVPVAPAKPPRQSTKSRIRVREDVDPRRQPTVKTTRGDGSPLAFRDAGDSCPPSARVSRPLSCTAPEWPEDAESPEEKSGATIPDRPRFTPSEPPAYTTRAVDRKRRLGAALLLGCVVGTLVFFWLRLPNEKAAPPASPPAPCGTAIVEASPPASIGAPAKPEGSGATSTPSAEATSAAPQASDRSASTPHAAPTVTTTARPAAEPSPRSTSGSEPQKTANTAHKGFLIRKNKKEQN